jgi:DTW domain-containing protein YfiP
MTRSRNPSHRCSGCRLHRNVCICDRFPTLPTRTRVVLLLHQLEVRKTTNTGRLALRCLPNSELVLRGRLTGAEPGVPLEPQREPAGEIRRVEAGHSRQPPSWLERAVQPILLFPHDEAIALTAWRENPGPLTLVVPDGTWSQAVRARRRVPGLAEIPCAALPAGLVSTYRLRHEPRPGRVSTLEAIAYALEILESPAVAAALLQVHRLAVERTLWTSGRLPRAAVWGGIPAGAGPPNRRGYAPGSS